jgi:uncharacterized protein DUF5681
MPDVGLQKTGETGGGRDSRGRFRRGSSGNPAGRPRGSLNQATRAAGLLLDGEAEALTRKAIELALAGDPVVLRLCLDRIVGPRRGRPVALGRRAGVAAARQRRRSRHRDEFGRRGGDAGLDHPRRGGRPVADGRKLHPHPGGRSRRAGSQLAL